MQVQRNISDPLPGGGVQEQVLVDQVIQGSVYRPAPSRNAKTIQGSTFCIQEPHMARRKEKAVQKASDLAAKEGRKAATLAKKAEKKAATAAEKAAVAEERSQNGAPKGARAGTGRGKGKKKATADRSDDSCAGFESPTDSPAITPTQSPRSTTPPGREACSPALSPPPQVAVAPPGSPKRQGECARKPSARQKAAYSATDPEIAAMLAAGGPSPVDNVSPVLKEACRPISSRRGVCVHC